MESTNPQPTPPPTLKDKLKSTETLDSDSNNLSYLRELFDKHLTEFYKLAIEKPLAVINIFNDFYGEDNVDIQHLRTLDEFKTLIYSSYTDYLFAQSSVTRKLFSINNLLGRTDKVSVHEIFEDNLYMEVASFLASYDVKELGNSIASSHILDHFPIDIIIHFPKVRITNEDGKYTDAENFYVKVPINYSGKMAERFQITRTTFSFLHYKNFYTHSHCSGLPSEREFLNPCLGVGPIVTTINSLEEEFYETLWVLFCRELDQYLKTESKAGMPYQYLERLTLSGEEASSNFTIIKTFTVIGSHLPLDKFITYLLSLNILKFTYTHGNYSIGMSYKDYAICVSNAFINWINENSNNEDFIGLDYFSLKSMGILTQRTVVNNSFYFPRRGFSTEELSNFTNKVALTFKGKDIKFSIENSDTNSICTVTLLSHNYLMSILYKLLFILNYGYRNQKGTDSTIPIKEKTLYL